MLGFLAIVGSLFFSALIAGVPAAIILRAAIWGDNKMTGSGDSPTSVPRPSIGKAIRISLFTLFYIFIAAHAMKYLPIAGGNGTFIEIFIYFLISVLIMASMLRYYLPTTFKSATRVALSWTLMISALLGLLRKLVPSEWLDDYLMEFLFGFVLITVLAVAIIRRATIREANKTTGGDDSPTPLPKPFSERENAAVFIGKTIVRTFVAILCIVLLLNPYTWMAIPFLFIFVLIAGAPAAIILRVAIWGDNKMTGGVDSPTAVPKPSIGKAIRISLFTLFYIFIVAHAMKYLPIAGGNETFIEIFIYFLISVLVMAGMLRFYLPITFMSAARVALSWTLMNCALLCLLYANFHQFIR